MADIRAQHLIKNNRQRLLIHPQLPADKAGKRGTPALGRRERFKKMVLKGETKVCKGEIGWDCLAKTLTFLRHSHTH